MVSPCEECGCRSQGWRREVVAPRSGLSCTVFTGQTGGGDGGYMRGADATEERVLFWNDVTRCDSTLRLR